MIRVLHIINSMNRGGAENAIMNFYRHVERDKVQFDFLLNSSLGDFEIEISSMGGRIYYVPSLCWSNPFSYLSGVNKFFKEHTEYKIVHSHTSSKSFFPLYLAKQQAIPIRISHAHSSQSERGAKGLVRNCLKWPLKRVATDFFACGKDAAIWLYGRKAYLEDRVQIIPNVIDAAQFRYNRSKRKLMRNQLGIGDDTVVLGNVARFHPVKNHAFLIEIFKEFSTVYPDSLLMLVGDGDLRDDILNLAKSFGIEKKLIITGVVPNVYDFEQALDFFVMPSFYEGLPLSMVEAQTAGLKCFASTGVPKDVGLTDLVEYVSLDLGAKAWADKIISKIGYERKDRFNEIQRAGFDAQTTAIKLQEFYLRRYEEVANQ